MLIERCSSLVSQFVLYLAFNKLTVITQTKHTWRTRCTLSITFYFKITNALLCVCCKLWCTPQIAHHIVKLRGGLSIANYFFRSWRRVVTTTVYVDVLWLSATSLEISLWILRSFGEHILTMCDWQWWNHVPVEAKRSHQINMSFSGSVAISHAFFPPVGQHCIGSVVWTKCVPSIKEITLTVCVCVCLCVRFFFLCL